MRGRYWENIIGFVVLLGLYERKMVESIFQFFLVVETGYFNIEVYVAYFFCFLRILKAYNSYLVGWWKFKILTKSFYVIVFFNC